MSSYQQTHALAVRFCDLMSQGDFEGAIDLYADDAVSIEAMSMIPGGSRETRGKQAILESNRAWGQDNAVHSYQQLGPFSHDDRFAVYMKLEVTSKSMGHRRITMEEVCLYTVKDGKITRAEFFYGPWEG